MPPASTTTSQDHHHHDNEQGLRCGAGIYGADRLNEKMERAHDLFVMEGRGLPNGWTLSTVLMNPFNDDELAPVLGELVALKNRDRWLDESYPERVATIVMWIAKQPWPWEDRCGAAWAAMWFGMEFHHYVRVDGHNDRLRWPEPQFFDMFVERGDSVSAFAAFLRRAYAHPDEGQRRQMWRLMLLARRRQQAAGRRLQAVVDTAQQRRRTIDLTAAARSRKRTKHLHRSDRKVIRQRAVQRRPLQRP